MFIIYMAKDLYTEDNDDELWKFIDKLNIKAIDYYGDEVDFEALLTVY